MPLEIVNFSPISGKPSDEVTITLNEMTADFNTENTIVYIGEERLHQVNSVDPNSGTIRVVIDEMARTGKFTVQGGDDKNYTTAAEDFTVTGSDETTPTITSIISQGETWGAGEFVAGQTLVATGRNLEAVKFVWIGSRVAPRYPEWVKSLHSNGD